MLFVLPEVFILVLGPSLSFSHCHFGLLITILPNKRVFIVARGLSVVALSKGYSLIAVCRLLIVVASLVEEPSL